MFGLVLLIFIGIVDDCGFWFGVCLLIVGLLLLLGCSGVFRVDLYSVFGCGLWVFCWGLLVIVWVVVLFVVFEVMIFILLLVYGLC